MTGWTIVMWSAARQIAEEAKLPEPLWPAEEVTPEAYFRNLRAEGEAMAAISYAAFALPKLEAIEWALASLPRLEASDRGFAARMLLRDAARRWLDEPDDENRRAIERLVEDADREWPETLIGLAIFFSGGSIAPPDAPPVGADAAITSSLLAGALHSLVATRQRDDPAIAGRMLDLADRLAERGREALGRT